MHASKNLFVSSILKPVISLYPASDKCLTSYNTKSVYFKISSYSPNPTPDVSKHVCIPSALHSLRTSNKNSGCLNGSPPEKVTPPPEVAK